LDPEGQVVIVSDSGMKGRVKGLLAAPPADDPAPRMHVPPHAAGEQEALQVLTLAQRTAEEHLSSARREADRICGEARDRAAQIVRDAQARGEALQREAEAALSEAHAAAAQTARDAQARADQAQQDAEEILSDAQVRADDLTKIAQSKADELQHLADQRYEDVVGSLAARREALQQQIEALERFDREYRARLQAFMQSQLRALWVEEPGVAAEGLEPPDSPPADVSAPAPPDNSDAGI
jgi:cell division septum initiation protein DivIVA